MQLRHESKYDSKTFKTHTVDIAKKPTSFMEQPLPNCWVVSNQVLHISQRVPHIFFFLFLFCICLLPLMVNKDVYIYIFMITLTNVVRFHFAFSDTLRKRQKQTLPPHFISFVTLPLYLTHQTGTLQNRDTSDQRASVQ